ncbi:UDP-glucosyltransferase 2-like [Cochliomyia hominivorax]
MIKFNLTTLILILISLYHICVPCGEAARILGIFILPPPVQYKVMAAVTNALSERGHQLTLIIKNSNQIKFNRNIRKILIQDENSIEYQKFSTETLDKSFFPNLQNLYGKGVEDTANVIKNPLVQQLMAKEKFDIILMDTFMSEALYGLGEYFNASMIGISSYGTFPFLDSMVGNISPLSIIPSLFLQHTFDQTFWQRCLNVALYMVDLTIYEILYLPHQRQLYGELFPNATLSFKEANRNFSLILLNQHFSLSFPRPYVPNMIEVAGIHIEKISEDLSPNIKQFLHNSPQGVIYINLGISEPSFVLNPNNSLTLLKAFKNLNYNIIWHMDYMPPEAQNYINILQVTNTSRQSLLVHPNIKLFITNGELLSVIEAVYYAKPILGVPMFADQHININLAIKSGYGLGLTLKQLNESKIKLNILELLTNNRYLTKIKELSRVFHDQPMNPKDKAIYWIEYILRHQGAPQLKIKGRFLNFWQFYNIDVLFAFLAFFIVIVFNFWLTMKFLNIVFYKIKRILKIKLKKN